MLYAGQTIHSFMGCGIGDKYESYLKMWFGKTVTKLCQVKVLIIDEISMISATFFEALSRMVRSCFIRLSTATWCLTLHRLRS